MNLYKYHDNAESLKGHDDRFELISKEIWDKFKNEPYELKKREKILARDAKVATNYTYHVLGERFKLAEPIIAKHPQSAILYAKLFGEFPEAEEMFARDGILSLNYAIDSIYRPFPKGEPTIAKMNNIAWKYLKAFPEREKALSDLGWPVPR